MKKSITTKTRSRALMDIFNLRKYDLIETVKLKVCIKLIHLLSIHYAVALYLRDVDEVFYNVTNSTFFKP